MSSSWGENIRISIFGQSHSAGIGVVVDGLPAGFAIDRPALSAFMKRRAPGQSRLSTPRSEADEIEFLSGVTGEGGSILCGAPLCLLIRNTNVRPGDYSEFSEIPRPGHADYTAGVKFGGYQDASGGGHFSGRLTAPLCAAGGIVIQMLAAEGIHIGSHIASIAGISDTLFDPVTVNKENFHFLDRPDMGLPVINPLSSVKMAAAIDEARAEGDSVGGVIECAVTGLPAGIGEPMFGGLENRIASIVFGIPAVKGIEFGNGFAAAVLRGSENNDGFINENGTVRTAANNHGGILGGISSGMPLIFRVAIKPTPSIAAPQKTLNIKTNKECELSIRGRHDPCIVPRATAPVEAAAAVAVYDALLASRRYSQN